MATVAPYPTALHRDAVNGDPLAQALVHIFERMEALEQRRGVDEETLHRMSYEAAAGAQTEVRKLIAIETDRRWYFSAALALAGAVFGFCAGWLAHGF
jgi:hypothetical protein